MTRDQAMTNLRAHRDELRRLGVEAIYLFGSVARDEANAQSDIDVLIDVRRPFSYIDLVDVKTCLQQIMGGPVDVGTIGMLKEQMKDAVLREAVRAA